MKNKPIFSLLGGFPVWMLLAFLVLGASSVFGQKVPTDSNGDLRPFLLLEKPGTKHRIRYYIGDEIEFKIKDEKNFQKGKIVQFSDTSFYVNEYVEVPLRKVSDLADRSRVEGVHRLAANTLLVIPVFFIFSAANNIFNTGNTPVIDKEVYPLSAVFVGISGLGFLYNGKRYRLKNRWRIIMVRL